MVLTTIHLVVGGLVILTVVAAIVTSIRDRRLRATLLQQRYDQRIYTPSVDADDDDTKWL